MKVFLAGLKRDELLRLTEYLGPIPRCLFRDVAQGFKYHEDYAQEAFINLVSQTLQLQIVDKELLVLVRILVGPQFLEDCFSCERVNQVQEDKRVLVLELDIGKITSRNLGHPTHDLLPFAPRASKFGKHGSLLLFLSLGNRVISASRILAGPVFHLVFNRYLLVLFSDQVSTKVVQILGDSGFVQFVDHPDALLLLVHHGLDVLNVCIGSLGQGFLVPHILHEGKQVRLVNEAVCVHVEHQERLFSRSFKQLVYRLIQRENRSEQYLVKEVKVHWNLRDLKQLDEALRNPKRIALLQILFEAFNIDPTVLELL